jgi:hypothetical protein
MAWHDCYDEVAPSADVVDDVLRCSEGTLEGVVNAAHLAVRASGTCAAPQGTSGSSPRGSSAAAAPHSLGGRPLLRARAPRSRARATTLGLLYRRASERRKPSTCDSRTAPVRAATGCAANQACSSGRQHGGACRRACRRRNSSGAQFAARPALSLWLRLVWGTAADVAGPIGCRSERMSSAATRPLRGGESMPAREPEQGEALASRSRGPRGASARGRGRDRVARVHGLRIRPARGQTLERVQRANSTISSNVIA